MYYRPVLKRRPASLTETEWVEVWNRGKLPREHFTDRDGRASPPPDVYDLVLQKQLSDLRWRVEQLCMALSRPMGPGDRNGSLLSAASPGQLLTPFSELWEFLSKEQYADGQKRVTGTISLKCTSSGISVTLTDPTSGTYCCQSAPSLDDAFLALEVGLKEGNLPWRSSTFTRARK